MGAVADWMSKRMLFLFQLRNLYFGTYGYVVGVADDVFVILDDVSGEFPGAKVFFGDDSQGFSSLDDMFGLGAGYGIDIGGLVGSGRLGCRLGLLFYYGRWYSSIKNNKMLMERYSMVMDWKN